MSKKYLYSGTGSFDGSDEGVSKATYDTEAAAQDLAITQNTTDITTHSGEITALQGAVGTAHLTSVTWDEPTRVLTVTPQSGAASTFTIGDDFMELINNVTSTETGKALTAAQGKVLKDLIDAKDLSVCVQKSGDTMTGDLVVNKGGTSITIEDDSPAPSGNTESWSPEVQAVKMVDGSGDTTGYFSASGLRHYAAGGGTLYSPMIGIKALGSSSVELSPAPGKGVFIDYKLSTPYGAAEQASTNPGTAYLATLNTLNIGGLVPNKLYVDTEVSAVQTQLDNLPSVTDKVSKAGDTMTGRLIMGGTLDEKMSIREGTSGRGYIRFAKADGTATGYVGAADPASDKISLFSQLAGLRIHAQDDIYASANDSITIETRNNGSSISLKPENGLVQITPSNFSGGANDWPILRVLAGVAGADSTLSLRTSNNTDWTIRNDDSESNRLDIRINNAQRAYLYEDVSGTSRWGNLYQTAGETRLGTYLPGDNDIRLKFNSGTGTNAIGFQIKRNAGETTGDVDYRNTGNGNHAFYTDNSTILKIQSNTSITSRGNLYLGYLDSTANNKIINICSDANSNTTAYIRRDSGENGILSIVNKGTGTFNLYNNNIKALRIDSNGSMTTHWNLHLGWNDFTNAKTVKLDFHTDANSNLTASLHRQSGANGNLILENLGTGYIYFKSRGKLYLEADTGAIYRSGTGTHQFENGYIKHASHANWTAVTFVNSWGNYGGGFQHCQYYKDAMGFVHLRGLARKAGTHIHQTAFYLPVGFRPAASEIFAEDANAGHRRIDIKVGGEIQFGAGNGDYVSISGITFYAG